MTYLNDTCGFSFYLQRGYFLHKRKEDSDDNTKVTEDKAMREWRMRGIELSPDWGPGSVYMVLELLGAKDSGFAPLWTRVSLWTIRGLIQHYMVRAQAR